MSVDRISHNDEQVKEDRMEPGYDRGIEPAEIAARQEREGENFQSKPEDGRSGIDTTGGYTVDNEGRANNYAIEPEMYVNEPGDLREREEANREARLQEQEQVKHHDEEGKLTMEGDRRGKGTGVI
jgi:hypothetical protein